MYRLQLESRKVFFFIKPKQEAVRDYVTRSKFFLIHDALEQMPQCLNLGLQEILAL